MNSNLSGKNVKLQIKNDESSVSRVYIEAPQTMNYKLGLSKNRAIDQIPGTTGSTLMKTTNKFYDEKNSTTATVVLETKNENINGEKQSEPSQHKTSVENMKKDNAVLEIQEMNPSSTTEEFSEGSGSQSMSISKFEITTQNSAILR